MISMSETSILRGEESSQRRSFRFLLCSSDTSDGLCTDLREILEQASELSPCVTEVVRGAGVDTEHLASRAKATDPDLVFLFLAALRPAEFVSLFQALRVDFASRPLIAVTDTMDAAELYELLRLGVSDFLITPLRSTDVLPRLARLID